MSRPMTTAEVAATFHLLADLLSIRGESTFRVNAYRQAAESLEQVWEPLAVLRQRGGLQEIPGFGREIAQKIAELLDTGTFPLLDEVTVEFPPGVASLLSVSGIGPKRARTLYTDLGIDSLDALRAALAEGKLDSVPGFGPGVAKRISQAFQALQAADTRLPLGVARRHGLEIVAELRERVPEIQQIELAGSIRRFRETIGDIDIAVAAEDPAAVVAAFLALPPVAEVEMQGPNRARVRLQNDVSADVWVLPPQHWGSLLLHTTGSKYHDIALRDLAIERGARLSEYGFTVGETLTPCATEEDVYRFLDMDIMPAPMRENTGEIELSRRRAVPSVIGFDQLRGDLHTHSDWSDGKSTIREMALAAQACGYAYLCVTDHSHSLAVARGLDGERLRAQRTEIDKVNAELLPFRVLQGVEVEVRADGRLDLDDETLAALDIVVASVHSGLRQERATLTERSLAAIRHPLVDVLAHPTGRIVGGRPGGDFDLDALFAEATRTGTLLEINSDPSRLDLRDTHARAAINAGCTLSIDSDAHSVAGLDNVYYGVGTAQRAWVPAERVLNTLPLDAMLAGLKRNRAS